MRLVLIATVIGALAVSSVAPAAGGVAGKYATTIKSPSELKGRWVLTLAKADTYTVALSGKGVLARGKYSATAKTITFGRESGGSGCKGSGTYAWTRSGRTMKFTRKREAPSCQARALILSHRFTQVR
jgi:hypothetical protein